MTPNSGREAGAAKLKDLREAWVQYTCPAVSEAAKEMLQQVSTCLKVPEVAFDLEALHEVTSKFKPDSAISAVGS